MTREEAIKRLIDERDNDVFASDFRDKQHEALTLAIKSLEALSAIDSIINREDSLIGRAQEDVIRYQMICKVMKTWKEGEEK